MFVPAGLVALLLAAPGCSRPTGDPDQPLATRENPRAATRPYLLALESWPVEFRHLAWVDQVRRLDRSVWPPALIVSLLLLVGTVLSFRGLDRSAP